MVDPEDEDECLDEPDDPDNWADYSEDHDAGLNEARDAGGWPDF